MTTDFLPPAVLMDTAWRPAAAAWLDGIYARTGSDRTTREYARHLLRLLEIIPNGDPAQVTSADVHAFAYGVGASGKEPSATTIMVRLSAISGFFEVARHQGLVASNPADDVARPRSHQPAPHGLDAARVRRLLETIPATPAGQRDRAIILTTVLTGMRHQDLFALRAGDIRCDSVMYYAVDEKDGSRRWRELPAPAFRAIGAALQSEGRVLPDLPPDAPVFTTTPGIFTISLQNYARRVGLPEVTLQSLRFTAARLRKEAGARNEEIAVLLDYPSAAAAARKRARPVAERDETWRDVAAALGVTRRTATKAGLPATRNAAS